MTVIEQGLLITGIGMGLVFVVIIFLWGLMALMMRVTSGKKRKPTEESLPTQTDEPWCLNWNTQKVSDELPQRRWLCLWRWR